MRALGCVHEVSVCYMSLSFFELVGRAGLLAEMVLGPL